MKITRTLKRDGTLGPLALNYLAGIPQQHLFFREQQLRHPAAHYHLSLEKLTRAFVTVLEGYERDTVRFHVPSKGDFDVKSLLNAQEHLLRCLQEHMDDCYLILKTLINPAITKSKSPFTDRYVEESKLPGAKAFMEATADYKASLRVANKLKHNQGRLRGCAVYFDAGPFIGYYLEEPDKAGVIGPSPEIHPDQGAFSFARDLKWRFFLVYSLSENLVKAVQRALAGLHRVALATSPPKQQSDDWNRLAAMIAKMPHAIFPKELKAKVANVEVSRDHQELSIKFPDRMRIVYPFHSGKVVLSTICDGFSTQFKAVFP